MTALRHPGTAACAGPYLDRCCGGRPHSSCRRTGYRRGEEAAVNQQGEERRGARPLPPAPPAPPAVPAHTATDDVASSLLTPLTRLPRRLARSPLGQLAWNAAIFALVPTATFVYWISVDSGRTLPRAYS